MKIKVKNRGRRLAKTMKAATVGGINQITLRGRLAASSALARSAGAALAALSKQRMDGRRCWQRIADVSGIMTVLVSGSRSTSYVMQIVTRYRHDAKSGISGMKKMKETWRHRQRGDRAAAASFWRVYHAPRARCCGAQHSRTA